VEIPKAPAEQPAEQSELQRSATLQHATPTEQGLTPAEPGPITEPVFESLDDKLSTFVASLSACESTVKSKSCAA
jgi:hypothetical protein